MILLWLGTKAEDLPFESEHVLHTSIQVETGSCEFLFFLGQKLLGVTEIMVWEICFIN